MDAYVAVVQVDRKSLKEYHGKRSNELYLGDGRGGMSKSPTTLVAGDNTKDWDTSSSVLVDVRRRAQR